jgi:alpha-L-fucosidase 2
MQLVGGILSLTSLLFAPSTAVVPSSDSLQAIEYSRPNGVPLYLDASIPEGVGPFPAVIIVHGGGWVKGDRREDVTPLFEPLEHAGIAWFSIDYRLLRDVSQLGAPVEDVGNAVLYVKQNAVRFRVAPDRIALIGESAGGQLAAMAALNPKPGASVRAVVGMYAPTDLVDLAKNSTLVPEQLRESLQGTPFENLLLAGLRLLSPLTAVRAGAPPFLLIHGTNDALVPFAQSEAMCARLKSVGSACELFPVEGGGHGMRWWESANPAEARKYKAAMIRWLRQEL